MTPLERDPLPRLGQVRRSIWALLVVALLVAMTLPLLTLWQAANTPLQAKVCWWPPVPQTQETIQMVVTLPDATDRSAVAGAWAHLRVTWDMTTMPMETSPLQLSGDASQAGTFIVPLSLDMAGPWWVDLHLQTPGRPAWHASFQFMVAPPGVAATPPVGLPTGQAPAPCRHDETIGT